MRPYGLVRLKKRDGLLSVKYLPEFTYVIVISFAGINT
jgi:hypothetical protein